MTQPGSLPGASRAPQPLPDLAIAPVAGVALSLSGLLIVLSPRYGYHRDELYFLAAGHHLAWGYPDQPPFVPLIARAMSAIAPGSLLVLRLPAAIASAALVLLTAVIARELGAERRAQVLAALAIAIAPLVVGAGHLVSTTTFGLPAWALCCWLVLRILRTGEGRLWLLVGLAAGFGLFDSDLIAFLLFAIVAGLATGGPRWPFRSFWLYTGGAVAVALWTPYLVWQGAHGWPELEIARSIASGGSGTSAPRWALLPFALGLFGYLAPVWVAGLVRLLRNRELRWCRAFGLAFIILVIVFTVTGGKPYYLGGMFPVLVGAGAQPTVDWVRRGQAAKDSARPSPRVGRPWRAWLIGGAVALTLTALPITLPLVPVADLHATPVVSLNYDAGETVGWPAYVREIASVYRSLPASRRSAAIVLGSNYGEAGAAARFGPADSLPAAYSGHNGFWYWGPPPAWATTAIAVGFGRGRLDQFCGTLRLAAHLNNHVAVNDDEQGAPVWVCSSLRAPWAVIWPRLRAFG